MNPLTWAQMAITDLPRFSHHLDLAVRYRALKKRLLAINLDEERARCLRFLTENTGADATAIRDEYRRSTFAAELEGRFDALKQLKPLRLSWMATLFDCETMYLAVRALKPRVAVETGMLYGGFTAAILQAMEDNGFGELYSFDLPDDSPHAPGKDYLVPPRLRGRIQAVFGDVKETLPPVLRRLRRINFFVHDTKQSADHMSWELLSAHRVMEPGGLLASRYVMPTPYVPSPFGTIVEPLGYSWDMFRHLGLAIGSKEL